MDKLEIKIESFNELILDTIKNYDNEEIVFDLFAGFLKNNDFLDSKIGISAPWIHTFYIDENNKTYENLANSIKDFLKSISDMEIDNVGKVAKCILNYLYVVYYRAIIKTNHDYYIDSFDNGLSINDSFEYLFGKYNSNSLSDSKGLIEFFYDFCIKQNLANVYMKAQKDDKSFNYLFQYFQDNEGFEGFLRRLNDNDFFKILSNFQNIDGFLDYRLFAEFALRVINILIDRKELIPLQFQDQIDKLINEKEKIILIRDSKTHVDFKRYSEQEFFADTISLSVLLYVDDLKNIIDKKLYNILLDLTYFGNPECKVGCSTLDTKLKLNELFPDEYHFKIKNFNYFNNLIYNELDKRNESTYKRLREEGSKISNLNDGENTIKSYVMKFLKNSKKSSYNYSEQKNFTDKDYEDLYLKINKDRETKEIIAAFEKRFEDSLSNGLRYDDYTFLLCGPIKLIEKMIKLEIKENYLNFAHKCDKKEKPFIYWYDTGVDLVPNSKQIFKSLQIGPAIVSLQNAIDHNGIRMPWFLKNKNNNNSRNFSNFSYNPNLTLNCHFYLEFASHVRNGYFHTDTISSLSDGIKLFYKVAYWFSQCLYKFNPYK